MVVAAKRYRNSLVTFQSLEESLPELVTACDSTLRRLRDNTALKASLRNS